NIAAIAAAGGYAAGDLLYVQVVLGDIGNYGDINDWWRRRFPDPARAPARLTYQAGALPFGAKIEFQAVAARRGPGRSTRAERGGREGGDTAGGTGWPGWGGGGTSRASPPRR